jgi:hypothetical protein
VLLNCRLLFLQYSNRYDCVISADENGFVEYWQPSEPFEPPKNVPGLWSYKSATDLYEFKKVCKTTNTSCTVSHRFGRQRQHQLVSPSPLTQIPLLHSLSPTVKYVYSLSSRANSPESMTSPSQLYKRCSKLEPLCTKSMIWSSADGLPWSGSWRCLDLMAIFPGCGVMRFGMRVGHLYCIQRCLGSRAGIISVTA